MLQARAKARFQRGSARKMRQVVDLVRGRQVNEALHLLAVLPKSAAGPVRKTLQSATANALAAQGTAHLKVEDLRIAKITVDGGPIMKRIRPMGMGRAYRLNKRLCHLTVVIEGELHETGAPAGAKTAKQAKSARAAGSAASAKPSGSAGTKTKAKPTVAKSESGARSKSGTGKKGK